uniref:Uncharacterized protein n=1 Tax=Podarcis muralis TaxID=64176 RepID=A0A670K3Q8_PODMU
MDGEAGWRAVGLGIVTGVSQGFSQSLVRLAPGSALLLVACSVAALEQLEGELHTACPMLHVRGLPADLASDDRQQRVVHAIWELRGYGPMELLLLVNNTGERALPRHAPEHVQSAFLLQVRSHLWDRFAGYLYFSKYSPAPHKV